MKKNCWEFKNCGRETNGNKVEELGVCPASLETKLDAIHEGINAGRCCWVVAGTYCKGLVQGTFAQKFDNCQVCDFYKQVKKEESSSFKLTAVLMSLLRK